MQPCTPTQNKQAQHYQCALRDLAQIQILWLNICFQTLIYIKKHPIKIWGRESFIIASTEKSYKIELPLRINRTEMHSPRSGVSLQLDETAPQFCSLCYSVKKIERLSFKGIKICMMGFNMFVFACLSSKQNHDVI